jgi:nicotinamidase/pyrazinamidase
MFPSLYNKQDAYAEMYPTRTAEFAEEGRRAGLRPAVRDQRKVALVIVDMQWDFVHPTGTLSVPGSQDDVSRLIEFMYTNVETISSVYASFDTHREYQIFYPTWWKYMDADERPAPFTLIGLQNGQALDLMNKRPVVPLLDPRWTLGTYLPQLKAQSQKDLMIWPYHTMEGTVGHNLMPALREALTFYSTGRLSQISYLVKGTCPQVEHYGIFMPEVQYPKDPNGGINTAVLDAIAKHDLIYVAGEAKSHCVLATMKQLTSYFRTQPEVIKKIRFLVDCTSSVQHPAVDFEALAQAELQQMAKFGVQLVKSTDTIR